MTAPDGSTPEVAGDTKGLTVKVEVVTFLGEYNECQVPMGKIPVRARLQPAVDVNWGTNVFLFVPPEMCTLVAGD
jgi:TOBE domain